MLDNELAPEKVHAELHAELHAEFHAMDDGEGRDRSLAAFEHSPEYLALADRGTIPTHVRPLLELAAERWLEPDDIDGGLLLDLIHELLGLCSCGAEQIRSVLDELHAFWAFAERELGYPHGRACMEVLRGEAERALACAFAHPTRPGDARRDALAARRPGQVSSAPNRRRS
jgi:hypothetical protein